MVLEVLDDCSNNGTVDRELKLRATTDEEIGTFPDWARRPPTTRRRRTVTGFVWGRNMIDPRWPCRGLCMLLTESTVGKESQGWMLE